MLCYCHCGKNLQNFSSCRFVKFGCRPKFTQTCAPHCHFAMSHRIKSQYCRGCIIPVQHEITRSTKISKLLNRLIFEKLECTWGGLQSWLPLYPQLKRYRFLPLINFFFRVLVSRTTLEIEFDDHPLQAAPCKMEITILAKVLIQTGPRLDEVVEKTLSVGIF